MTKPVSGRRYLAIWLPYLAADRLTAAAFAPSDAPIPTRRQAVEPWLPPGASRDFDRRGLLSLAPGPLEQSTAAVVAGNPLPRKPAGPAPSGCGQAPVNPFHRAGVEPPRVFVEKVRGALRLAALSPAAVAEGLSPGQDLASARALVPDLDVIDHDPGADRRWLERIADACERFTPLFALDPPDGIVLDITGVGHLWGGEVALVQAVEARFAGLHIRLGTGASPEAAGALARFGREGQTTLGMLPIAALRLDDAVDTALRRAGLHTIGQLAERPTAPLSARFGAAATLALDRLLNRIDSRITPRRAPPALVVERRFAEPIAHAETALTVLSELLGEAAQELDRRGRGGRRFATRFFRSDNATFDLAVETGLPARDPAAVMRLFRERIEALNDPLDPGFGFDLIRLAVPVLEPLAPAQLALAGDDSRQEELAALVDRLSTRLGRERVRRLAPRDTHIPEQAAFSFPAADALNLTGRKPIPWPAAEAGEPPLRPLHLFDPPQPIQVTAGLPDGPPRQFRWRRAHHVVTLHEGPERIAAEWWRLDRKQPGLTRDYYRVEDARGRRFWIFRHGLQGSETGEPRWYVHGLFA